ncbi:MAG: hypothetical protein OQL09_06705 [Gammaproteobacteria bacterium]|nr:hypothetical protein [Gammaproteobacteria bacterium]
MKPCDMSKELQHAVIEAFNNKTPLNIQGSESKGFYGRSTQGQLRV